MEGNPQSASTLLKHDIQPGEQMTFGSYPHFADGTVQPIVWRVLQNTGDELFLLSEEILDCKRYHGKSKASRGGMPSTSPGVTAIYGSG